MLTRRTLLKAVAGVAAGLGWKADTVPAFMLDEPLPALEAVFPVRGQPARIFPIGFGKVGPGFVFETGEIIGDSFLAECVIIREVGSGRRLCECWFAASNFVTSGMILKVELGDDDEDR